MQSLTFAR